MKLTVHSFPPTGHRVVPRDVSRWPAERGTGLDTLRTPRLHSVRRSASGHACFTHAVSGYTLKEPGRSACAPPSDVHGMHLGCTSVDTHLKRSLSLRGLRLCGCLLRRCRDDRYLVLPAYPAYLSALPNTRSISFTMVSNAYGFCRKPATPAFKLSSTRESVRIPDDMMTLTDGLIARNPR
jgi:hypothetical protein